MFLAIKEIKKEKRKFLLIISIVVLLSYLVFFLMGLAYGLAKDNRTAIDLWKAEKIVLQKGSNKNIQASNLDKDVVDDFGKVDFSPINLSRSSAIVNGNDKEDDLLNLVLIGVEKDTKIYPKILEGRDKKSKDEIVASISLKEEKGLKLEDTVKLTSNNREFTVVGFSEEAKFNTSDVIYTSLEEASAAMMNYRPEEIEEGQIDSMTSATPNMPERLSGLIVHDSGKLDGDLEKNYDIVEIKEFINKIPGYYAQVLTFGLMIGFLILIASIVLGVFMFIVTMQKKETFGIMKIQGISASYIRRSVFVQTMIVSILGIGIGLILTYVSDYYLPVSVPFKSNILFFITIGIVMLITIMLGAVFSINSVNKVDPLDVLN